MLNPFKDYDIQVIAFVLFTNQVPNAIWDGLIKKAELERLNPNTKLD